MEVYWNLRFKIWSIIHYCEAGGYIWLIFGLFFWFCRVRFDRLCCLFLSSLQSFRPFLINSSLLFVVLNDYASSWRVNFNLSGSVSYFLFLVNYQSDQLLPLLEGDLPILSFWICHFLRHLIKNIMKNRWENRRI